MLKKVLFVLVCSFTAVVAHAIEKVERNEPQMIVSVDQSCFLTGWENSSSAITFYSQCGQNKHYTILRGDGLNKITDVAIESYIEPDPTEIVSTPTPVKVTVFAQRIQGKVSNLSVHTSLD